MEAMIECILVPQNPAIEPTKVLTTFDMPYDDAYERTRELRYFMETLEDLRCAVAKELGVERKDLLDEAIFFRINVR